MYDVRASGMLCLVLGTRGRGRRSQVGACYKHLRRKKAQVGLHKPFQLDHRRLT
jgi:hypothetical protein